MLVGKDLPASGALVGKDLPASLLMTSDPTRCTYHTQLRNRQIRGE